MGWDYYPLWTVTSGASSEFEEIIGMNIAQRKKTLRKYGGIIQYAWIKVTKNKKSKNKILLKHIANDAVGIYEIIPWNHFDKNLLIRQK